MSHFFIICKNSSKSSCIYLTLFGKKKVTASAIIIRIIWVHINQGVATYIFQGVARYISFIKSPNIIKSPTFTTACSPSRIVLFCTGSSMISAAVPSTNAIIVARTISLLSILNFAISLKKISVLSGKPILAKTVRICTQSAPGLNYSYYNTDGPKSTPSKSTTL